MATSFDNNPKGGSATIDEDIEQGGSDPFADAQLTPTTPSPVPNTLAELEAQWAPSRPVDREVQYRPTEADPDVATASIFIVNAKGDMFASSREALGAIGSKRQFMELLGLDQPERELSSARPEATIYFEDGSKLAISAAQVDRLFGPDEEPQVWDGDLTGGMGLRVGLGSDYELSGVRRVFDRETGDPLEEKLIPPTVAGRPTRS